MRREVAVTLDCGDGEEGCGPAAEAAAGGGSDCAATGRGSAGLRSTSVGLVLGRGACHLFLLCAVCNRLDESLSG